MPMKKTTALILLILTALVCLSSCGHVSSLRMLKLKAKQNGKCTYLRCEEGDDYRTAYFEDELGFEYYIKSYMSDVVIDGANFGSTPSTSSNFKEKYFEYLCDKVNSDHQGSSVILKQDAICNVKMIAQGEIDPDDVAEMGNEFTKLEDRRRFIDSVIPIYESDDDYKNRLGSYGVAQKRYLDETETKGEYYMDRIKEYTSMKKKKTVDPEYTRCEHMDFSDVPGLSEKELGTLAGDPDPKEVGVNVYYFDLNGKEYFITDALVYDESNYGDVYFYNSYISDPYER